jgi:hypothetical protein
MFSNSPVMCDDAIIWDKHLKWTANEEDGCDRMTDTTRNEAMVSANYSQH